MRFLIRFALRIPAGVYEALKGAAEKESRSLNGQIIHLLRQGLRL